MIMENINQINDLSQLLEHSKGLQHPVLVKLNSRVGSPNFLMDRMVRKLIRSKEYQLTYEQLETKVSKHIQGELQILKNPVLLLIHHNEIVAIFSEMIAPFQLEAALKPLLLTK